MGINKNGIKFEDETGRSVTYSFVYTEGGKEYDGALTLEINNVGGMDVEDYEVAWEQEPPNYNPDTDDEIIYETFRDFIDERN